MGLKRFLRSPADHDHSTLFVLCQKTEWVGGWGWWWGAFNHHGFTLFELLKLCNCQNDDGWLLTSPWKLFWSWQKIIIWSDGQQICNINPSDNMYPYVPTICTHIYIYLRYVPIFMYNMYSYLYTIFSHIYHIYIQYVPTYIYLQYVPISIYTSRNMYHHIKVLVLISTKYNEVEV